jgi:hypothetical protein
MLRHLRLILLLSALSLGFYLPVDAQVSCGTAPAPRLTVGESGRVLPGDSNNLRDTPSRDGARIGAIEGGGQFIVLEGPVCADDLNWWKVDYNGLVGWTVEGMEGEYWVEPYEVVVVEYEPAPIFEPPFELVNLPKVGDTVRVTTGDTALRFRAEPLRDAAVVGLAEDGDLLTLLDGPQDSEGYRWWRIQDSNGAQGWAIEGYVDQHPNYNEMVFYHTFISLCPLVTDRIAFVRDSMIYTANQEGGEICQMVALNGPRLHTFWSYLMYLPNTVRWSPDGQNLSFVNIAPGGSYELFTLSADGSRLSALTPGSSVIWMDWSPDGERIALSRTTRGQSVHQIWVINADGSFPVSISSGSTIKPWVSWLDNERIIYIEELGAPRSQMGAPTDYQFHIVGADLSSPQPPIKIDMDVRYLLASPAGQYLVYGGFLWDEMGEPSFKLDILDLQTRDVVYTTDQFTPDRTWQPGTSRFLMLNGKTLVTVDAASGSVETRDLVIDLFEGVGDWLNESRFYAYGGDTTYLVDLADSKVTDLHFSFETFFSGNRFALQP